MSYTCMICKEKSDFREEMTHFNINGDMVADDERSMEINAANPDYAPIETCIECAETVPMTQELVHELLLEKAKSKKAFSGEPLGFIKNISVAMKENGDSLEV